MNKNKILAAALIVVAAPVSAQVGVSVSVGEPGFYGQLNIGGAPAPQLVYPQPVVVAPAPQYRGVAPIYLRVPPGYAEHWSQHCAQYGACGRPVYFVRDDWYRNRYMPYYHEHHGAPHHNVRGHQPHGDQGRDHSRGHDHH